MNLTDEQQKVVAISAGRHLVLAPPGSGKTEMLSQRIVRAVESGIDPARMLCATFTNRAAFEMRARVEAHCQEAAMPEVGNLHHFCFRFLCSVKRLSPTRHILDECEQLSFVKEVVDALRAELKAGAPTDKGAHGVTVLRSIRGVVTDAAGEIHAPRVDHLHELVEEYFAAYAEKDRSPYAALLTAVQIAHQRRIGIPRHYLRAMPPELFELDRNGVVRALSGAYVSLKRKFYSVDFDDLINEAYLYLEQSPLADERRYSWVLIDEVQDLNPLQWQIVRGLTASQAVSVYFGDAEQAIFSFLGASEENFAENVCTCERHFFKTNFRATPLLLEILMRYSLDALRSEWAFLPQPSDARRANGEVFATGATTEEGVLQCVRRLLDSGTASNVAILVRRNLDADLLEMHVRELGCRYTKVSGVDLFALAAMRDFIAYVSVLVGKASRTDWARLMRRFASGVFSAKAARYLVREMFAAGFEPMELWEKGNRIPSFPYPGNRRRMWAWRHRKALQSLRETLRDAVQDGTAALAHAESIRALFKLFSDVAFGKPRRYSLRELWPELGGVRDDADTESFEEAEGHSRERIEKFLRYVDSICKDGKQVLGEFLSAEWDRLRRLKEADLLVGDEKIVLSTIHKAKGRQFDAIVIPDVTDVLKGVGDSQGESDRLLYVAMSRAKRHLMLFGCPDTPVFRRLKPCFAPGYTGYYLQKADGKDLSGDWLFVWEQLAALNAESEYQEEFVTAALGSANGPLVRMALKVMRYHPDREALRQRYLEMARGPSIPCDCLETLVNCLSACFECAREVMQALRALARRAMRNEVWGAALRYCQSAAKEPSLKAEAMACLADELYCRSPELRIRTAQALFDLGDVRWVEAVKGTAADFDRLGKIDAPAHEETIRALIAATDSCGASNYAKKLRNVIFVRAQRIRGPLDFERMT